MRPLKSNPRSSSQLTCGGGVEPEPVAAPPELRVRSTGENSDEAMANRQDELQDHNPQAATPQDRDGKTG